MLDTHMISTQLMQKAPIDEDVGEERSEWGDRHRTHLATFPTLYQGAQKGVHHFLDKTTYPGLHVQKHLTHLISCNPYNQDVSLSSFDSLSRLRFSNSQGFPGYQQGSRMKTQMVEPKPMSLAVPGRIWVQPKQGQAKRKHTIEESHPTSGEHSKEGSAHSPFAPL